MMHQFLIKHYNQRISLDVHMRLERFEKYSLFIPFARLCSTWNNGSVAFQMLPI